MPDFTNAVVAEWKIPTATLLNLGESLQRTMKVNITAKVNLELDVKKAIMFAVIVLSLHQIKCIIYMAGRGG